jgi:WD40 repeat protein
LHDIGSTPIVDMKFSPNGKQVLTISSDHTMRLWETTSGKHLATWEGLMCLEFSPDGTKILTGSMSGGAQLWETTSGKQLTTLKDYTGIAVSAAFFPNSSEIFISSADGTTGTWETVSGTRITTPQHLGHLMTISPDGTKILLEKDGTLLLWEQASESLVPIKNLLTTNPLVDGRVGLKVAFSPNGERFVTSAMFAQTVGLWETASGALLAQFPIGIGVDQIRLPLGAVEFSPDSRFLIICDGQGQVFLWSLGDLGRGHPLGAYVADDEILAIHWQDTTHVILAGTRGASSQPKISYLKLEGTW